MNDPELHIVVDARRSASLSDQGSRYNAATLVGTDGAEYFMLLDPWFMGCTVFDPSCSTVYHEAVGPLPADVVRRIAIGRADG